MRALLVQPPFAQLNSPYPAIHYLSAFLRGRGIEARTADHSIELYRSIFSRRGLGQAFDAARRVLAGLGGHGDEAAASHLERYLSYEGLYLEWIDGLAEFLAGGDPSFAHRLSRAAELPRGMRAEAFLEARGGRCSPAEARALATAVLEDLGDLISYALDPGFSTVRYGERVATSASSFSAVRSALDSSPLLDGAYLPLLASEWRRAVAAPDFLLVTIPFPGCLLGALACARSAREAFGKATRIAFGGGYVSTELRSLRDGGIFDFCDYLSFDAGYGSLASIVEVADGAPRERLFRTMYRGEDGRVVAAGFAEGDEAGAEPELRGRVPCDEADRLEAADEAGLRSIAPDYSSVDFRRYLHAVDSENPMHRLWSDSPWLKYRLAHGCYWRRCAFCDTGLDYVARYRVADLGDILEAADRASAASGLHGIHFVDEAMPMGALLAFARANRARASAGKRPFHYWGNVRFDASWTLDRCEFLAASGLVAASGGIEIATEGGLETTGKGFDMAGLVRTLVAMKRAGLLVHAYLIYGFPGQSRSEIVDSAEACRQLFACGLVDSAFWHRFVLTRHSRMLAERRAGGRPGLAPLDGTWDFANNDLRFEGEGAFDEFDGPLSAALEDWMSGEGLARPAAESLEQHGLRRARPGATVAPDLVSGLAEAAGAELDIRGEPRGGRAHWIAGAPAAYPAERGQGRLAWTYRGEAKGLSLPREAAEAAAAALSGLARLPDGLVYDELASRLSRERGLGPKDFAALRSAGLVVI